MSRNMRGPVKGKYWFGSKDGQIAKKAFEQDCRGDEEGGPAVASADVLGEILELSELPVPAGDSEALKPPDTFVHRPSFMRNRKRKASG
jgi:hypothetical protein